MKKGNIDWNAVAEKAKGMSEYEIRFAISDIRATLGNADAMDRQDNGDRGGYYRDEISIYTKELKSR